MSTPKPGQIRCPTCLRSTPPAAFCTQCGNPIPSSARLHPRGMDRDELDERLHGRSRGEGGFRRGREADRDRSAGYGPYQPFTPEPEDEVVRRGPAPGGLPPIVDNTPPGFDERPAPPPPPPARSVFQRQAADQPPPPPPPAAPPSPAASAEEPEPVEEVVLAAEPEPEVVADAEPQPEPEVAAQPEPEPEPEIVAEPEPEVAAQPEPEPPAWQPPPPPPAWQPPQYQPEPPRYAEEVVAASAWDEQDDYTPAGYHQYGDDDDRGGGIGPLMVGLFVVLGIAAVGIGAMLAGVFNGGVSQATPTPSVSVSFEPTPSPSLEPTPEPTLAPTPAPTPGDGSPIVFPDGFTAETQPCAEQPDSFEGCNSSGTTVTGGEVWVWIRFLHGTADDVVSVSVVDSTNQTVDSGEISLSVIEGCGDGCNGWLRFRFIDLAPGSYGIRVSRNGLPAAESSFTVLAG